MRCRSADSNRNYKRTCPPYFFNIFVRDFIVIEASYFSSKEYSYYLLIFKEEYQLLINYNRHKKRASVTCVSYTVHFSVEIVRFSMFVHQSYIHVISLTGMDVLNEYFRVKKELF